MKDRINESLSALCDGECDELELRRVLNYVSNDPEMRERWNRYNLIGAVMREESARVNDISQGVMQALDALPSAVPEGDAAENSDVASGLSGSFAAQQDQVTGQRRQVSDWLVSGAVAASVTLAVLFGARVMNEVTTTPAMMMAESSAIQQVAPLKSASDVNSGFDARSGQVVAGLAVSGQAVSGQAVSASTASVNDIAELRSAQEALQQYVREQDGAVVSGTPGMGQQVPDQMTPYARVANFGRDSSTKE